MRTRRTRGCTAENSKSDTKQPDKNNENINSDRDCINNNNVNII